MRGLQCDLYTINYNILSKHYSHIFYFVLFVSIMLGLNFHIFLDEICYSYEHKTIFKKIEKDFQGRVVASPAPTERRIGSSAPAPDPHQRRPGSSRPRRRRRPAPPPPPPALCAGPARIAPQLGGRWTGEGGGEKRTLDMS